jgi:hypothetical protein
MTTLDYIINAVMDAIGKPLFKLAMAKHNRTVNNEETSRAIEAGRRIVSSNPAR